MLVTLIPLKKKKRLIITDLKRSLLGDFVLKQSGKLSAETVLKVCQNHSTETQLVLYFWLTVANIQL